jgi:hypothetical protein
MDQIRRLWGGSEPPPTEPAGDLERIPRRSSTATASREVHLRVATESKAAQNLRGALQRAGKRVGGAAEHGRLMTTFCVDTAELDLQRFTGSIHVCACAAFDQP